MILVSVNLKINPSSILLLLRLESEIGKRQTCIQILRRFITRYRKSHAIENLIRNPPHEGPVLIKLASLKG